MNVFSHFMMGKLLYHNLKNIDIKLKRNAFIFGNIKPDVSSRYNKLPHYKKDVYSLFKSEVLALCDMKVSEGSSFSSEYSEKLGVICHFISDFFCFAHCEQFDNRGWNHFIYEMKLSFYMLKRKKSMKNIDNLMDYSQFYNTNSIFEEMDKENEEYFASHQSEGMDVLCSLQNCISMVLAVVNISKVSLTEEVEVDEYESGLFYGHVLS